MILSGHQHNYLPWFGFFEKLIVADVFVIDDTSQYEKKSFMNRNKIKTSQGSQWLTVPIKSKNSIKKSNNEIYIDYSKNWIQKHKKALKVNYGKSPYFHYFHSDLCEILDKNHKTLLSLNWDLINYISNILEIDTKILFSSNMSCQKYKKSDFVLEMCKECGVNTYFSGQLGADYLIEDDFEKNNINIIYQRKKEIVYNQQYDSFIPNLSIIDILFNCGISETKHLLRSNANEYLGSSSTP